MEKTSSDALAIAGFCFGLAATAMLCTFYLSYIAAALGLVGAIFTAYSKKKGCDSNLRYVGAVLSYISLIWGLITVVACCGFAFLMFYVIGD